MTAHPLPCLVLTDGRAGNLRQARALALALGHEAPAERVLQARAPWRWLAPRRLPGVHRAWGGTLSEALAHPPALVIGCGRQAALATRELRRRGSRAVQILDPRIDSRHWDVVVAPAHDRVNGANVVTLTGSLHPVDEGWLATARREYPAPGRLPGPRVALLLGGPIAAAPLDAAWWRQMHDALGRWRATLGGSLLLGCSPRTPPRLAAQVGSAWPDWHGLRWHGAADGPNPYPGLLAWADHIVVSPDSVNMVSEACATTATVSVAGIARCSGRQRRFLDDLLARGRIAELAEAPPTAPVTPLRETQQAARAIRERLQSTSPAG